MAKKFGKCTNIGNCALANQKIELIQDSSQRCSECSSELYIVKKTRGNTNSVIVTLVSILLVLLVGVMLFRMCKSPQFSDKDKDGIVGLEDECPDKFGECNGCPCEVKDTTSKARDDGKNNSKEDVKKDNLEQSKEKLSQLLEGIFLELDCAKIEQKLIKQKFENKIAYSDRTDAFDIDECYIIICDEKTGKLVKVLDKGSGSRVNLLNNEIVKYEDYISQRKLFIHEVK